MKLLIYLSVFFLPILSNANEPWTAIQDGIYKPSVNGECVLNVKKDVSKKLLYIEHQTGENCLMLDPRLRLVDLDCKDDRCYVHRKSTNGAIHQILEMKAFPDQSFAYTYDLIFNVSGGTSFHGAAFYTK